MQIKGYLNLIDRISASELICRCCGAYAYTFVAQNDTFCSFCEAHVSSDNASMVHAKTENGKSLASMQKSASSGAWEDGVQYADALASTKDIFFLYGASMFYRFFSDFTYNDVNYEQGGFMYSNAEKRSDDFQKNKYNAMALISKSKEYLFKIIKTVKSIPNPDAESVYLKFMSNMKLKRYPQAAESLMQLVKAGPDSAMSRYAELVFSANDVSNKTPNIDSAFGSATFFYYLAKHLANSGNLEDSIKILDRLAGRSYMPMAFYYKKRVADVNSASRM